MPARLASVAVLLLLAPALVAQPTNKPAFHRDSFLSGEKKVRVQVDRFEPAQSKGKNPAVLLLHGAEGMKSATATYHNLARTLADAGFVVLLVHYFDRTGTRPEDGVRLLPQLQKLLQEKEEDRTLAEIRRMYHDWMATIRDALAWARQLKGVDGDRVALAGLSLGGFLSASVAMEEKQKVAALVCAFGGLPRQFWPSLKHLPPTLILHGDADAIVPVKGVEELSSLLQKKMLPHSLKIQKNVGHCWLNPRGEVMILAALEAQGWAVTFLRQTLKP